MKPLCLMLIEEHAAVRWALETRLISSPAIQSIDVFADLSGALKALESLQPDMILLGLDSGRATTLRQKLEAVVRLSAKKMPIMVLVPYVDDLERELLLRVGASRYCLKNINTPQLLEEIEQTVRQSPSSTTVKAPVAPYVVPETA
jgi:DNA-binding NarL/FixJ family response regulator